MELTGLQWLQVDSNAKDAIHATTSYSSALIYADKKYKLLNWDKDVFEATLSAITTIYERGGSPARGKTYDKVG